MDMGITKEDERLVRYFVRKFQGKTKSYDADDLRQIAYMGLLEAKARYDETKGYAFSTYAVPTMYGFMMKELQNHDAIIRVPIHAEDKRARFKKANNPADGTVMSVNEFAQKEGIQAEYMEQYLRASNVVSANAVNEQGHEIVEAFCSEKDEKEQVENKVLVERLMKALSQKEREVISAYYEDEKPLRQIGKERGVSAEAIRLTLKKALEKMRCLAMG